MSIGLYSASGGMALEMKRQESIATNIASSSLPGYKREFIQSSEFTDAMYESMNDKSEVKGIGIGGTIGEKKVDFSQGALKQTGRPLDFAINGKGFFEVQKDDNSKMYTKNGSFMLAANGDLITSEGYKVLGDNGVISFNPNYSLSDLTVSNDGTLMIEDKTGNTMNSIDKLSIINVENTDSFKRVSGSYFTLPPAQGARNLAQDANPEEFSILNRTIETSNAAPIKEMVSMIASMREFEMSQKVLKMFDTRFRLEQQKLTR